METIMYIVATQNDGHWLKLNSGSERMTLTDAIRYAESYTTRRNTLPHTAYAPVCAIFDEHSIQFDKGGAYIVADKDSIDIAPAPELVYIAGMCYGLSAAAQG
jgi:hypothetical protein